MWYWHVHELLLLHAGLLLVIDVLPARRHLRCTRATGSTLRGIHLWQELTWSHVVSHLWREHGLLTRCMHLRREGHLHKVALRTAGAACEMHWLPIRANDELLHWPGSAMSLLTLSMRLRLRLGMCKLL